MAPVLFIYLFLIFIPLSHGQLNLTTPLTNTTISTPSHYSAQALSNTVDQPTSVLLSSSHPVLNTQGNSVSSAAPLPISSIKWTTTFTDSISGTIASSKSLLVQSSKSTKYAGSVVTSQSGQLLPNSSTLVPQTSSIMEANGPVSSILVTTGRKPTIIETSSSSVSMRASRTSKSKIMPTSTAASLGSSKLVPNPASSRNLTSSQVILYPSSTPAGLNLTNSSSQVKLNPTVSPGEPNSPTVIHSSTIFSSKIMLNSTSPVIMNQSSFSVMRNSSATPTVLKITSSSSKTSTSSTSVSPNLTSSEAKLNFTSSSAVKPNYTATSVVLNITSTHVVKSMITSVVLTSQSPKERSTVFQNSSTAANEPSCYTYNSSRSCIKLQPSSTIHYKPTSQRINISTSLSQNGSMFFNVSSMASAGKESSVHKPTPAPGPYDKEESHTTLIVGLTVGLSLGMVLIIMIIVYYRRKRASYQYNVFYDEQNIVMHPFDYAK